MTSIIITFKPTGSTIIYDSVNAAAEGLGVKPNSVSQWVGGHTKPPAYIKAERLNSKSAPFVSPTVSAPGTLVAGASNDNYNSGV